MWVRAETGLDRLAYLDILKSCPDYVGNDTDEVLDKIIGSGCEVWLYQGVSFSLALALRVIPGREKVVNGVPSQNAEPEAACRVMISKIREVFDGLGVKEYYATLKDSYNCRTMGEFCEYMGRICHEFKGIDSQNGKPLIRFDGSKRDKLKDPFMEGPLKDEPLPNEWLRRKEDREKGLL